MSFTINTRTSMSPFIDLVWYTQSQHDTHYIAPAQGQLEMIITRRSGDSNLSVWGPSQNATVVTCPKDAEFVGIRFSLGTYMSSLLTLELVNTNISIPTTTPNHIRLDGYKWQLPKYDEVEMFVAKLVKRNVITRDTVISAVLQGHSTDLSVRSVQRRFRSIVGLSQRRLYQVERANEAVTLLQQGISILDTVHKTGYFDQPHLTRALKQLIGKTPAEILDTSSIK